MTQEEFEAYQAYRDELEEQRMKRLVSRLQSMVEHELNEMRIEQRSEPPAASFTLRRIGYIEKYLKRAMEDPMGF